MATKTSLLTFYLTLSRTNKIFRISTLVTLAIVNIAGLALTFLNIFQCRPFSAAFKTPIPQDARCQDIVTLYLSSAPVNIITDLAILFLPMPILTAMRLPRKQKTILVVTFGFGFFVTVVDVIRIVYLQDASLVRLTEMNNNRSGSNGNGTDQRNTTDVSWYASLSYMWSAVEVNVGIMCGCVPGLKPLVSRFMPYVIRDVAEQTQSTIREPEKTPDAVATRPPNLVPQPNQTPSESAPGTPAVQEAPRAIVSLRGPPTAATHDSPIDVPIGNAEDSIGMMDFLTTPDMSELPQAFQRPRTPAAHISRRGRTSAPTFFDFVTIERKKPMVEMTNRESLFPNIMVTILFFLWGVAYGFLDTLNAQFQKIAAHMGRGQTIGIHSAYFAAYFFGTLTFGRLILKHWGFKACYIVGLCIYACGTLVFWPSAVLTSFPAFLVSNFIVGLGLSTLEIAANPFVALCGPSKHMEMRLNISQGVQAIGTVVSPLLASKVLFRNVKGASSLVDVQWTYLGIALFTVLLAVAYYYVPLPEATDDELEESSQRPDLLNLAEIKGTRLVFITLFFAAVSQFFYLGGQEAISNTLPGYLRKSLNLSVDTTEYLALGHSLFACGRFLAAFLNLFIKPRILLLFFYIGALVLSILAMHLKSVQGEAVVLTLYAFEGPIFPIIYAICLRGMGRYTKDGSALMAAAISGGGVFPPIMFRVADGIGYQPAYRVVVAAFTVGLIFPLYLNFFPLARKQADHAEMPILGEDNDSQRRPSDGSERRSSEGVEIIHGPKLRPTAPAVQRIET
jgi:fucose permease